MQGTCVFSLMLLQKAVRGNVVRGGGTLLLFIKLKIWFQVRPGFGNLHIAYMHNTHTYLHIRICGPLNTCIKILYIVFILFSCPVPVPVPVPVFKSELGPRSSRSLSSCCSLARLHETRVLLCDVGESVQNNIDAPQYRIGISISCISCVYNEATKRRSPQRR